MTFMQKAEKMIQESTAPTIKRPVVSTSPTRAFSVAMMAIISVIMLAFAMTVMAMKRDRIDLGIGAELLESLGTEKAAIKAPISGRNTIGLKHHQPFIMLMSSTAMVPRLRK